MQGNQGTAHASIDWRDWVAFVGYVLATAVVVSVMLASVVLVLSMQADPLPATGAPNTPTAAQATEPKLSDPQVANPTAEVATNASPRIEITSETLRAETPIEQTLQTTAASSEAPPAGSGIPTPAAAAAGNAEVVRTSQPAATAAAIPSSPETTGHTR